MSIGTILPNETSEFVDPETGRRVRRFTAGADHSYPLYYFTSPLTANGRSMVIHRQREGWTQLYRLDLTTGEMVQLTNGGTTILETMCDSKSRTAANEQLRWEGLPCRPARLGDRRNRRVEPPPTLGNVNVKQIRPGDHDHA